MTPKVFESEYRFCQILWEQEPVNSTQLVKLCRERLGWSKGTTYTVIRRLAQRGVLKNEDTIVSSLVSREEVQMAEFDELVERTFDGSLPQFVAAFTKHRRLTEKEAEQIQQMIDRSRAQVEAAGPEKRTEAGQEKRTAAGAESRPVAGQDSGTADRLEEETART